LVELPATEVLVQGPGLERAPEPGLVRALELGQELAPEPGPGLEQAPESGLVRALHKQLSTHLPMSLPQTKPKFFFSSLFPPY
jgi:hypothetical protein